MLDTVLFELEGVIADTAEARRDAVLSSLRVEGVQLTDDEYRSTCAGLTFEDAVRAALRVREGQRDETIVAITALRAERAFRAFLGKGMTLTEGSRETIERLHASVRLGLVTRVGRAETQLILSLAQLEHAFSVVVAQEDTPLPKPAPEPYRIAMARLERLRPLVQGRVVVAVEDGLAGIRAARSAGLTCVVVGDVPAHVALEANGLLSTLKGTTAETLLSVSVSNNERIS
jgi:HAD superfamily hydrolase (TIGR01509 family)